MANGIRKFQMEFIESDHDILVAAKEKLSAGKEGRVTWSSMLLDLAKKELDRD